MNTMISTNQSAVSRRIWTNERSPLWYQVSAQAGEPAIRSGEARLSVMSPPGQPSILEGQEVLVSQGEERQLTCQSRGGRPAGEVTVSRHLQLGARDWSESKQINLCKQSGSHLTTQHLQIILMIGANQSKSSFVNNSGLI